MRRHLATLALSTCLAIGSATSAATAQSSIDGIWFGAYTSKYSPTPTREVLMFGTTEHGVVGVYLSKSGAAGTLDGLGSGDTYSLGVTQPVDGCPEPARGVLHVSVAGDRMKYAFKAASCKGTDFGSGEATRSADPGGGPPASQLEGFWKGVYTSIFSPEPTHETLVFESFGAKVTGVYLSESGATGILTGMVKGDIFSLKVDAPTPPCPSSGTFNGHLDEGRLSYSFSGADCHGQVDQGKGKAEKFVP